MDFWKRFISLHRFNDEVDSIYFISKYFLQIKFATIISIDETKRTITIKWKKNQVNKIFCQNTFYIS